MATDKQDLTFISTRDLIDELHKRHDAIVVGGIKFIDNSGKYRKTRFFRGHRLLCLGVVENIASLINNEENSSLYGINEIDG